MYIVDENEKQWLMSLTPSDITMTFLKENFAGHNGNPPKKEFVAYFTLDAGRLGNKESIKTTVGRYIFNLLVFEGVRDKIEYMNTVMNKKGIGNFIGTITDALLEDEITVDQYKQCLNRANWLGYGTVVFTAPAFTDEDLICPPKTAALRKKLFKQYAEELEKNDVVIGNKIEQELIASAQQELRERKSPLMDYFDSGSRGSFGNSYKNMTLMRGVVPVLGKPGEFEVGKSNLIDGTTEEEQALGANILIEGASGRAIQTAEGGYLSKQLTSAFQGVELDKEGSDCGTKRTMKIKLTKDNANEYKYSYIVDKGKLVLLDRKTLPLYIGQEVNWRTPMYCQGKKYCEHCYGRLPYLLNVMNVGITFNGVGEKFKKLALKAFHDMTVKLTDLNLNEIIRKE